MPFPKELSRPLVEFLDVRNLVIDWPEITIVIDQRRPPGVLPIRRARIWPIAHTLGKEDIKPRGAYDVEATP